MTQMSRAVRMLALTALLVAPPEVDAQVVPGPCTPGLLPSGALSLICVPAVGWNGQLVVYAHGYVAPELPLDFYQITAPDGTPIPLVVQLQGFAFATTSYRQNGLAILEGADDIRELVAAFSATRPAPTRTHLAGVSEGGLVTTLLAERSPELFASALAACGPIGSFRKQIEYLGDFRVLFDYFFPGVIPGSPVDIPASVRANWMTVYVPTITAALAANPSRALELMRTARAAYDPAAPATIVNTAINALWYNVFGTNDAALKLGGNPYGNRHTLYFGSSNDLRLNLRVQRITAAPAALAAVQAYETSGDLSIPLVTLHTTLDEVVPFRQELIYLPKVDLAERGRFIPLPVARYGHCNFTTTELLGSFLLAASLP
jgi:pimeloyl-ACP methyl ester carboxylesterase